MGATQEREPARIGKQLCSFGGRYRRMSHETCWQTGYFKLNSVERYETWLGDQLTNRHLISVLIFGDLAEVHGDSLTVRCS